jgi:hypothetical protein
MGVFIFPILSSQLMKPTHFITIFTIIIFSSCASSYKTYKADKKFERQPLQQDFTLLRNILEQNHPALYWYTPKERMDFYFDSLYNTIADSMTEQQYGWQVIAPLTQKIHCGHTTFGMSKNWNRFMKNKRIPSFPLFVKTWSDTMVVTGNLNSNDSIIKRGTIITSINSIPIKKMQQQMFQFLPSDGYADNVNYIRLSSNFPYFHRSIYGIYKNYRVGYLDSTGNEKKILLPMWLQPTETSKPSKKIARTGDKKPRWLLKKERRESYRSMEIDTAINTATFTLNTFSGGNGKHLKGFIKQSFRQLKKDRIGNLIIDLRSNGGGDIDLYALLTKYIRNTPFKVADSAYAVTNSLKPYSRYIKQGFFANMGLFFLTKKRADGNYHFGFYERHVYHPKRYNHFDGKVYVLINGPTFSAATLFCHAVKGQPNVPIAGEESGGGWHGNSGIMIPDITLPNTKLKVRLPLFKIVQYNHVPKDGRGVVPDIYIPPTVEGVIKGLDRKMMIVKELIKGGEKQ